MELSRVRCPYCHDNITVQGRFCPKCGEQIFGRPVARGGMQPSQQASAPSSWQAPSPQAGGDVLEIELEDAAEAVGASDNTVGQMCPFCRFPIKEGEEVVTCPDCSTSLHADCWRENGGCATYGCSSSPQAAATRRASSRVDYGRNSHLFTGPMPPGARELIEAEFDGQCTNVLIFAILQVPFCLGLLSIIALAWGVSLLSQMKRLQFTQGRPKAIAAVVISGAVSLGWVLYFVLKLGAVAM